MSTELLVPACEFAYEVARRDARALPPTAPPAAMREYLELTDLPPQAIVAAQQAIEDSGDFRRRVAAEASPQSVGRAGYLWLVRPEGWAAEFERLGSEPQPEPGRPSIFASPAEGEVWELGPEPAEAASDAAVELPPDLVPVGAVEARSLSGSIGGSVDTTHSSLAGDLGDLGDLGDTEVAEDSDVEVDALESELSSLRGLVDRLAGERERVQHDPLVVEFPAPSAVDDPDFSALQSDLETARHELSLVKTDLAAARQDREETQRLHSETLKRQVVLERQLDEVRQERSDVETRLGEAQAGLTSLEERLSRAESQLRESERENGIVRSQLETLSTERNQIREDRAALKAERDDLLSRVADVEQTTGGADLGELMASNRTLTHEFETTSRELTRVTAQAEHYEEQVRLLTTSNDELKSEKIDLRARLADAELGLETTRTQFEAVKLDAERLASEVGTLRAERDGLQSQLTDLQSSLTQVLDEQASTRARRDEERRLLNEIRIERDVLAAKVNDLEQSDRDYETRIRSLLTERDSLVALRDELVEERGQLRGEAAVAATERTQLQERLDETESRLGPLQTELQAERRQREELANRLLELDDEAERNAAELASVGERTASMAIELDALRAERVEVAELTKQRNEVSARLAEVERDLHLERARLEEDLSAANDKIGRMEKLQAATDRQLAETRAELEAFEEAAGPRDVEVASLRRELDGTRSELELRSRELELRSRELEEAKSGLQAKQAELEAATSELSAKAFEIDSLVARIETDNDRASSPDGDEVGGGSGPSAFGSPDSSRPPTSGEPTRSVAALPDQLPSNDGWSGGNGQLPADGWAPAAADSGGSGWTSSAPVPGSVDRWTPAADGPSGDDALGGTFAGDEEDLDEIGDLIARTVSSFGDDPTVSAASAPTAAAALPAESTPPGEIEPVTSTALTGPPADRGPAEPPDLRAPAGGVRRRRIEIPPEIAEDELAVARHVVSAPDMVLLVDGDSVAAMGWPTLPVVQQRDALVTYLADLAATSGASPDVVFDGRVGDDNALPMSSAVRMRLSNPPTTEPTAALDELVDAYPEQWAIALVTDNPELAASAHARGAAVLNNGQLLDLFLAQ